MLAVFVSKIKHSNVVTVSRDGDFPTFYCTGWAFSSSRPTAFVMSDSPMIQVPLDPKEQPILDSVLAIRDSLSLLKQDRSSYIKSRDVTELYDKVIEQVHLLNMIRADKKAEQNRGRWSQETKVHTVTDYRYYLVDTILDDCFQLISLFFLTIGKNNEAPAVYVNQPLCHNHHVWGN